MTQFPPSSPRNTHKNPPPHRILTPFSHPAGPGRLGSVTSGHGRTKLAPLGRISGPAGAAAGRVADDAHAQVADEPPPMLVAHTPPQVDARARARKTAAELGVREPPRAPFAPAAHQQKKRLRHPTCEVEVENNGNVQLERTPTPVPGHGRPPSKGRDSYSGRASFGRPDSASKSLFDELEEGLMESILDAEAEPSPRY